MTITIVYVIITLSLIGLLSAIVLYFVAQRFRVVEDPRIDQIQELLPAANCGGCGFAGCRNFAEEIVRRESLDGLFCPVGGNETLKLIGPVIGQEAQEQELLIAVVRCNGTHANAPGKLEYEGIESCYFMHALFSGENGCPNGCLGGGDCVEACTFDAMYMDGNTGLPVVIQEACVACGACVKACPRHIIELRPKGKKDRRIFVSCMNAEKGGPAKKNCDVACIGCGKCVKVCAFDAIRMENNLAYIDASKCTLCRKCVSECPTHSIWELNFPERRKKEESSESKTVMAS